MKTYKVGSTGRLWQDGMMWFNGHMVELENYKELPVNVGDENPVTFGWRDWEADVYYPVVVNLKRVK